jgi:hypothetical protein
MALSAIRINSHAGSKSNNAGRDLANETAAPTAIDPTIAMSVTAFGVRPEAATLRINGLSDAWNLGFRS